MGQKVWEQNFNIGFIPILSEVVCLYVFQRYHRDRKKCFLEAGSSAHGVFSRYYSIWLMRDEEVVQSWRWGRAQGALLAWTPTRLSAT